MNYSDLIRLPLGTEVVFSQRFIQRHKRRQIRNTNREELV